MGEVVGKNRMIDVNTSHSAPIPWINIEEDPSLNSDDLNSLRAVVTRRNRGMAYEIWYLKHTNQSINYCVGCDRKAGWLLQKH